MKYLVEQCTDPNFQIHRRDDPNKVKWEFVACLSGSQQEAKDQVEHHMIRTGYTYRICDLYTSKPIYTMQVHQQPPRPSNQLPPQDNVWRFFNFLP
jgi:hypothetical protein